MEVIFMLTASVWLMLSSMLCSLRVSASGKSFPKPLSAAEERHYLELSAQGDLEARNILIERNLRLVAHIMLSEYQRRLVLRQNRRNCHKFPLCLLIHE